MCKFTFLFDIFLVGYIILTHRIFNISHTSQHEGSASSDGPTGGSASSDEPTGLLLLHWLGLLTFLHPTKKIYLRESPAWRVRWLRSRILNTTYFKVELSGQISQLAETSADSFDKQKC